ncbi:hypothetical protein ABW20_dc0100078 [Dactylellina cionopaga]|nr:hypothetical protein ABW20_dc0100078 [Dactylellina cionopaga]
MFASIWLIKILVFFAAHTTIVRSISLPGNNFKHRSNRYSTQHEVPMFQTMKQKRLVPVGRSDSSSDLIKPKVLIVAMFSFESNAFLLNYSPSLYGLNFTVPGFSPRYPQVSCTSTAEVCHMTTGEGEINAAASISALVYSGLFDLSKTYFLIAGVAGINPYFGTTGTVTFPRFAVQLALQYEVDSSQLPKGGEGFSSGYFTQGTKEMKNNLYPSTIYGTEVFELNDAIRKRAFSAAKGAKLFDTDEAAKYRRNYPFSPAKNPPRFALYWAGSVLAEAFGNFTTLLTNGTGQYCSTQQEDNATLAALIRASSIGLVDFARIIILRTGSDFDRAPPNVNELYHLLQAPQGGFPVAIANIYLAGVRVVDDIVNNWANVFEDGIKPTNYIGDVLNTLGSPYGYKPDIGVESQYVIPA